MKLREIKEKTPEDLSQILPTVEKRLSEVAFGLAAGRVKNVKEAASLRRTIARIKTILRERSAR